MKRILVLCTGNSCRSQMAEAYLRQMAGSRASVFSAGLEAHGMNPKAVQVLEEDGVDVSGQYSKTLDVYDGQSFDFVITVCDRANESCPVFPAARFHHDFPDPARATGSGEEILQAFRSVRDAIRSYCADFVKEHLPSGGTSAG